MIILRNRLRRRLFAAGPRAASTAAASVSELFGVAVPCDAGKRKKDSRGFDAVPRVTKVKNPYHQDYHRLCMTYNVVRQWRGCADHQKRRQRHQHPEAATYDDDNDSFSGARLVVPRFVRIKPKLFVLWKLHINRGAAGKHHYHLQKLRTTVEERDKIYATPHMST